MLQDSFEWIASKREERFRVYRQARMDFESYLAEHPVPNDVYTEDVFRHALADARMSRAEEGFRQAIELTSVETDSADLAVALSELGWLLCLRGRLQEARNAFYESLQVMERVIRPGKGMLSVMSTCQYQLGLLDIHEGHYAAARTRLGISITLDEELGEPIRRSMGQFAVERCPQENGTPEPKRDPSKFLRATESGADGGETESAPDYLAANDEEVDTPGIFKESTREAIWIMASSRNSAATMRDMAQRACPANRELVLYSAVTGGDSLKPPPIEPNTSLCAALFEISPEALGYDDFRYWLQWCISRADANADFRLFVHLRGINEAEFMGLSDRDDLIAELRDKVQLHRPDRLDLIEVNLRSHLLRLEMVRDAAKGRAIRRFTIQVLGSTCQAVLALAICFQLLLLAGSRMISSETVAAMLAKWGVTSHWLGVFIGLPLAWGLLIPVAVFLSGFRKLLVAVSTFESTTLAVVSTFLVRETHGLFAQLHLPIKAIAAGGLLGLLMEAARRRRFLSAKAKLLTLGQQMDMREVPSSMLVARRSSILQWPLFATGSKVFLSYSRSSAWGNACAGRLYARLNLMGYDTFLDRRSIPLGASWQHELDERIAEADIFIVVCDADTVKRPWVAAEVGAALEGRHLSGVPQILMIQNGSVDAAGHTDMRPAFRSLLSAAAAEDSRGIRSLAVHDPDEAVQLVTALLGRQRSQAAVFPSWLLSVLLFFLSPVMALVSLAWILGLPSLLIGIGVQMGKIDLQSWFAPRTLWWIAIAAAALACSTMRHAFSSRFEGAMKQKGRRDWSVSTLYALGFAALGLTLWRHFSSADYLWLLIAGWLAIDLTGSFVGHMQRMQSHQPTSRRA